MKILKNTSKVFACLASICFQALPLFEEKIFGRAIAFIDIFTESYIADSRLDFVGIMICISMACLALSLIIMSNSIYGRTILPLISAISMAVVYFIGQDINSTEMTNMFSAGSGLIAMIVFSFVSAILGTAYILAMKKRIDSFSGLFGDVSVANSALIAFAFLALACFLVFPLFKLSVDVFSVDVINSLSFWEIFGLRENGKMVDLAISHIRSLGVNTFGFTLLRAVIGISTICLFLCVLLAFKGSFLIRVGFPLISTLCMVVAIFIEKYTNAKLGFDLFSVGSGLIACLILSIISAFFGFIAENSSKYSTVEERDFNP